MKVKCVKTDFGTPPFSDMEINKIYEVYEVRQNTFSREYLIKDSSRKRKWYKECLFEEVSDDKVVS